jgi:hypothetical protein
MMMRVENERGNTAVIKTPFRSKCKELGLIRGMCLGMSFMLNVPRTTSIVLNVAYYLEFSSKFFQPPELNLNMPLPEVPVDNDAYTFEQWLDVENPGWTMFEYDEHQNLVGFGPDDKRVFRSIAHQLHSFHLARSYCRDLFKILVQIAGNCTSSNRSISPWSVAYH